MATATIEMASRPEDVGIDSEKLEALFARVERDVDDGTLPSAQVAIARDGKLAGFRTFGKARQDGREQPATDATMYVIYSSTKAVVGAAVWALFDEGLLRLDERVAEIIPEFASNGKEIITIEQLMTHTGGFPMAPFLAEDWDDRDRRLGRFAQWRLNWEPGSQFQYHATSAHWTMAEIIERKTGKDFRAYLRERVLDPSGIRDLYVGLPDSEQARVAEVVHVVPPEPPPGGFGEVTPEAILNFNRPQIRAIGVPGGGGVATAAGLAMFYQPLINGGVAANGTRILKAETIEMATTVRTGDRHRDPILGHTINRALAVVVAGADGKQDLRGFGRTASSRAFGHGGAGGQIGWGDPETGISVGYCTNGFVDQLGIGRRGVAVSSLAGSCLAN